MKRLIIFDLDGTLIWHNIRGPYSNPDPPMLDILANTIMAPFAYRVLSTLRARGYTTAILTNADELQRVKISAHGLDELVDRVIIPRREFWKPHRQAFDDARRGFDAQECLMVGDDATCDYKGAQDAGIDAVLYRPNKYPEFSANAISDLRQLLEMDYIK